MNHYINLEHAFGVQSPGARKFDLIVGEYRYDSLILGIDTETVPAAVFNRIEQLRR